MKEFILLMHNNAVDLAAADDGERWNEYLSGLRSSGRFGGGSLIDQGLELRKGSLDKPSSLDLTGFIRVRAESMATARRFLTGNPVYEAGGTVEIRELPVEE
jgi:hypothetical protein